MAGRKSTENGVKTTDYRHKSAKRKNIPPARIAGEGQVPQVKKTQYHYSPHLSPELRFDSTGKTDRLSLVREKSAKVLSAEDRKLLDKALTGHQPWLEWAGKKEQEEKGSFDVGPVVLHIHERISTQAILNVAKRENPQRDLFADPDIPYQEQVKFYQHDIDWANRVILGDSLQVMSSLAKRENLAGKVDMIYIDPPYGVRYGSNFQPELGNRDVKDRENDLSREAEMVKAFRDTWHLGVHSYLCYMHERLIGARELLSEKGSVFVQISDDNVHLIRNLMDEVFGRNNFVSQIVYVKTTSSTSNKISAVHDIVIWYGKSEETKFRTLYSRKIAGESGATGYHTILLANGERLPAGIFEDDNGELALPEGADLISSDNCTSQSPGSRYDVPLQGHVYRPEPGYWKTDTAGMTRLLQAERILPGKKYPGYLRKISDFT